MSSYDVKIWQVSDIKVAAIGGCFLNIRPSPVLSKYIPNFSKPKFKKWFLLRTNFSRNFFLKNDFPEKCRKRVGCFRHNLLVPRWDMPLRLLLDKKILKEPGTTVKTGLQHFCHIDNLSEFLFQRWILKLAANFLQQGRLQAEIRFHDLL